MVTEFWLLENLEIYLHGKIKIVFLESLNDNKAQALRSGDPTDFCYIWFFTNRDK